MFSFHTIIAYQRTKKKNASVHSISLSKSENVTIKERQSQSAKQDFKGN